MSIDRFISWPATPPEWGLPTPERLMRVLKDFLGDDWEVSARAFPRPESEPGYWILAHAPGQCCTSPLASENDTARGRFDDPKHPMTRAFEVFLPTVRPHTEAPIDNRSGAPHASIITRQVDAYTGALADEFTRIVARWWSATVEWPT